MLDGVTLTLLQPSPSCSQIGGGSAPVWRREHPARHPQLRKSAQREEPLLGHHKEATEETLALTVHATPSSRQETLPWRAQSRARPRCPMWRETPVGPLGRPERGAAERRPSPHCTASPRRSPRPRTPSSSPCGAVAVEPQKTLRETASVRIRRCLTFVQRAKPQNSKLTMWQALPTTEDIESKPAHDIRPTETAQKNFRKINLSPDQQSKKTALDPKLTVCGTSMQRTPFFRQARCQTARKCQAPIGTNQKERNTG